MSMAQFMTDAFTRLRSSGLISVCLINGSCIGGGAELATVCDFRYGVDRNNIPHYEYNILTN